MPRSSKKNMLSTLKTVLIAGYAVSLFLPYKVEKHDGETTYHAPLYKISYKSSKAEATETGKSTDVQPKEKTVHTYTVTSFGLLNDQIATAQRLYKVALLKRPAIEAKARASAKAALCKAKGTAKALKSKVKAIKYPYIIEDVTDRIDSIIENVIG